MSISTEVKLIKIEKPIYFDLDETLNCGQCFRFKKYKDDFYEGVAKGAYLKIGVSKDGKYLLFEGASQDEVENIWLNYFALDEDYSKIAKNFCSVSPIMESIVNYAPGIRILRQEPFEALCSFIISQNNNIPRISKIIALLCERYGEKCKNNKDRYCFPSVDTMASLSEKELRDIGCGFRDKYLLDAAKKLKSDEINLEETKHMDIQKARETLQKIKGIGPKVAECILLYGMHRLECFPYDVWIKRAMNTLFPGKNHSIFGEYAGIAQQYIYHYSRNHPEIFEVEI